MSSVNRNVDPRNVSMSPTWNLVWSRHPCLKQNSQGVRTAGWFLGTMSGGTHLKKQNKVDTKAVAGRWRYADTSMSSHQKIHYRGMCSIRTIWCHCIERTWVSNDTTTLKVTLCFHVLCTDLGKVQSTFYPIKWKRKDQRKGGTDGWTGRYTQKKTNITAFGSSQVIKIWPNARWMKQIQSLKKYAYDLQSQTNHRIFLKSVNLSVWSKC